MPKLRHLIIGMLFSGIPFMVFSAEYYFFVQFTDKKNTPFTLDNPADYLSPRSLARRAAFQLVPDSTDLPVNPAYVSGVQQAGVTIHSRSKWLNGVTIFTSDSSRMQQVRSLPFVRFVQYTGIKGQPTNDPSRVKWEKGTNDYGTALEQLQQVNGHLLHEKKATGKGILIGILDAGFKNVNLNVAFDSLRASGRIVDQISIVDPAVNVFNEDSHGATVLSVMGGNLSGSYKGSAPDASYLLIQTEYVPTEYLSELDFWVRGIEYADSAGVDVINSSLGYTQFDDTSMNFTYADMNGKVSRASIAAEIAASKGIIVCNSAGNDGNKTWKYIGSPADAHNILTVGSVDKSGNPSAFSSFGPTFDQRIKPELSARGSATAVVNTTGTVTTANGTSFSSPLMAGLMACYLQLLHEKKEVLSIEAILQRIIATGSQYDEPIPQMGYGIPDFSKLPEVISSVAIPNQATGEDVRFSVDPLSRKLVIDSSSTIKTLQIYSVTGHQLVKIDNLNTHLQIDLSVFPSGIYLVNLSTANGSITRKLTL